MSLADKLKKEKEKLESTESKGGGGGDWVSVTWFVPEKGKNFIRFVENPVKDTDGEPILWVERTLHFNLPVKKKDGSIAKISTRCLRDLGKSCPMCDKYEELLESGDKEGANNFKPTQRYLYNIINYKTKKAEVMSAGAMIHKGVVESIDLGVEFWDLKKGLDFKLVKEVEAGKPARFGTKYNLMVAKLDRTPLPEKLLEEVNNTVDLQTLYADDNGEKMVEAFGGKLSSPTGKKTSPKAEKKEVEEYYDEEDEETETTTSLSDSDLEAELKSLGL